MPRVPLCAVCLCSTGRGAHNFSRCSWSTEDLVPVRSTEQGVGRPGLHPDSLWPQTSCLTSLGLSSIKSRGTGDRAKPRCQRCPGIYDAVTSGNSGFTSPGGALAPVGRERGGGRGGLWPRAAGPTPRGPWRTFVLVLPPGCGKGEPQR